MFPSGFQLDNLVTKAKSRQTQSLKKTDIDLNFGRMSGQSRRSSFLPENWDEEFPEHKYRSLGASVFRPKHEETGAPIIKEHCTGSKYTGQFNKLGMAGKGIYKYPHGVIYDGYFNKGGEFHGSGFLIYPNGQKVEGVWKNGKLVRGANCVNADDVPFAAHYCKMPDRRFQIEIYNELAPAGQEYLTNARNPPIEVLKGCYDSGEGFYDPERGVIYGYNNPKSVRLLSEVIDLSPAQLRLYEQILQVSTGSAESILNRLRSQTIERSPEINIIPVDLLEKWIIDNCRKDTIGTVGYRPQLYEYWTTGKHFGEGSMSGYNSKAAAVEDRLVHEIVAVSLPQSSTKSSSMFSFIVTPDDKKDKKVQRDSTTVVTLSKMLIPKIENSPKSTFAKTNFHHAKKYKAISPGPKSVKSKKAREVEARKFIAKLRLKIKTEFANNN